MVLKRLPRNGFSLMTRVPAGISWVAKTPSPQCSVAFTSNISTLCCNVTAFLLTTAQFDQWTQSRSFTMDNVGFCTV